MTRSLAVSVMIAAGWLSGCSTSKTAEYIDPKTGHQYGPQPDPLQPIIKRLLGAWFEDSKSPYTVKKYSGGRMPARRSIEFFRDGTAISHSDDGAGPIIEQFTWAVSEDGKRIRTTGPQRALLARIVLLTDRELRIEGPSLANGHFLRE